MLLLHTSYGHDRWRDAFRAAAPDLTVVTPGDGHDPREVRWAAAWGAPEGAFAALPALRAVFPLGAGVDAFVGREDIPAHVPIIRLVDAGMAPQMLEYALFAALWFQRDMDHYVGRQHQETWEPKFARDRAGVRIGVLGLGALGGAVARGLAGFGYPVAGWRRGPGEVAGIATFHGRDGLAELLARTDLLLCLLPSTPETAGLLDRRTLALLPPGAAVVNVGRGSLIVAEDLRALLDTGHLRGAVLDVFATEPLPAGDPLWSHPKVLVTPHVAAGTLPEPAAAQIVANIERIGRGEPPIGLVDRRTGY